MYALSEKRQIAPGGNSSLRVMRVSEPSIFSISTVVDLHSGHFKT